MPIDDKGWLPKELEKFDVWHMPQFMRGATYVIEHRPLSVREFSVRFLGLGQTKIHHDSRDAVGDGRTPKEAAEAALKQIQRGK